MGLLSTNVVLESCAHIFLVAFVINIREKKFDVFFFFFAIVAEGVFPTRLINIATFIMTFMYAKHSARCLKDIISLSKQYFELSILSRA